MYIKKTGFTLIELLVTISIMGILLSILYANFESAREQSRDKVRMTGLKELQLALELYKAQNNGQYPDPDSGCSASPSEFAGPGPATASDYTGCSSNYIDGLVPDFIAQLPTDPNSEYEDNKGFYYRTNADNSSYKVLVYDTVETLTVDSYSHEFARCPKQQTSGPCSGAVPANTYAVYSFGAEDW